MAELKTLLEVRNEIKERKPIFIRQDNPKRMKLNYKWRKPKGIHSKIRHRFKGRRKMPSPGYKSPAKVKNLHSSGLEMINLASIADLEKIKKETQGIIVSKNTGMKKRLQILKKANEMGVSVLNLNSGAQIKRMEDIINSKKKAVKETKKEAAKKEEGKKESKEKESKPREAIHEQTEEERKELEKKEKDKVLTKKV